MSIYGYCALLQQKILARESELASDKALMDANQQQEQLEAELTRQAKLDSVLISILLINCCFLYCACP